MASVFVSYAREDASKARAIALALDQAGFDTWIDERIHSGAEFSREIEQALAGAGAVVVLWSTTSIDSAWVRDEAAEGRDSGRLVAVLLDTCRPPIGFRQFQATDLSRWSGRGRPKQLDSIIAAVRSKAGESPKPQVTPATEGSRLWLGPPIWLGIALVLAAVAVGMFFFIDRSGKQAAASPSIAILPFTADPSDPDGRRLASEARNSIAHTLSHGAFAVTTIDSAPNTDRPPADFLLTGQVSTNSGNYSATVRMDETAHHYVVFSRQFEASRDKGGDFAELIGAQVAALVSWTAPILAVERRHPSDPAITAALLQSTAENFDSSSILHDYETSRRLAAKAPDSPLAQNGLAFDTAFALPALPRDDRAAAVAAARRAVDRTIELAPEFGGGYIPWCMLRSELWLVECEDHLRTGMRVDPDAPFNDWFLAVFLNNVGRNREATELATVSLAHDQYMPYKIALMLRMLEVAGRTDEEASLYRQAQLWWPGSQPIAWYRRSGTTQGGDFEAVERLRRESDPKRAPDPLAPLFAAVKTKSTSAGKAACSKIAPTGFDGTICMLALARLGDMDGAYRFADALYPSRLGRTPAEEEEIWLSKPDPNLTAFLVGPSAAPLRRDLRYIPLATRVGLVRYWRSGRPPDFCRERPEPICPKLLGRVVVVKT